MHPTHTPPHAADPTPADILRHAALYLQRHGWHQGDMFTNPDLPTPPACAQGAIRMAVCGSPTIVYTTDTATQVDTALAVLADYLVLHGYLDPDDHDEDCDTLIGDWNDTRDRTLTQVTAALLAAADDWQTHHNGGAT